MSTLIAPVPEALPDVAAALLRAAGERRIFAFYGKMGAGKTALIKAFAAQLGSQDRTGSPTYALVNEYLGGDGMPIYHFDFYRIEDPEEAYDIGFEEYLDSGAYCFIEWPERIASLIPDDAVEVRIRPRSDGVREVTFKI